MDGAPAWLCHVAVKLDAEFHGRQGDAPDDAPPRAFQSQHRLTAGVIVAAGGSEVPRKCAAGDLVLDLLMISGELAVFVKGSACSFQRVAAKRIGDILDHALGQDDASGPPKPRNAVFEQVLVFIGWLRNSGPPDSNRRCRRETAPGPSPA